VFHSIAGFGFLVSVVVHSFATIMSSALTLVAPPLKLKKPEPAMIEFKNLRFLITERPSEATMERFIAVSIKASSIDVNYLIGTVVSLCFCSSVKDNLIKELGHSLTSLVMSDIMFIDAEVNSRILYSILLHILLPS
jgi:hypothetical protein